MNEEEAFEAAQEGDWATYNERMQKANEDERKAIERQTGTLPTAVDMPPTRSPTPERAIPIVTEEPRLKL